MHPPRQPFGQLLFGGVGGYEFEVDQHRLDRDQIHQDGQTAKPLRSRSRWSRWRAVPFDTTLVIMSYATLRSIGCSHSVRSSRAARGCARAAAAGSLAPRDHARAVQQLAADRGRATPRSPAGSARTFRPVALAWSSSSRRSLRRRWPGRVVAGRIIGAALLMSDDKRRHNDQRGGLCRFVVLCRRTLRRGGGPTLHRPPPCGLGREPGQPLR